MTEYTIYTYPIERLYCYPIDIEGYSFTTTEQGKGYLRQRYVRKGNNTLDFYKTEHTLLEMGLKVFSIGASAFLYVQKDIVVHSHFIDHMFAKCKRSAVFYETENAISALGYVFRNGPFDKGYYLDTPSKKSKEHFYHSKSIKELGYTFVNDFDGKSGYIILDPQRGANDVIQELFTRETIPKSIFPQYMSSSIFAGHVDGYTFTTKEGKTGYYKNDDAYNIDSHIMTQWFSRLKERARDITALETKCGKLTSDTKEYKKQKEALSRTQDANSLLSTKLDEQVHVNKQLMNDLQDSKATISELKPQVSKLEAKNDVMAVANQSQAELITELINNKVTNTEVKALQDDIKSLHETIKRLVSINEEQTRLFTETFTNKPQYNAENVGNLLDL